MYADPEAFRPERFLDAKPPSLLVDPVRRRRAPLPRRRASRWLEMRAVMQTILQQMDLRAAERPGERIVRRMFTLSPARGTRVVATPR